MLLTANSNKSLGKSVSKTQCTSKNKMKSIETSLTRPLLPERTQEEWLTNLKVSSSTKCPKSILTRMKNKQRPSLKDPSAYLQRSKKKRNQWFSKPSQNSKINMIAAELSPSRTLETKLIGKSPTSK